MIQRKIPLEICFLWYKYMFMDMCIYVSILNMHFCIQLYWYSSSSSLNSLSILVHLFGSLGNWNIRNVSMNFLELWCPGELRQEEHQQNIRRQQHEKGWNIYFEFPCVITIMGNPQLKTIVSINSFAPVPVITFPFPFSVDGFLLWLSLGIPA